MKRKVRLVFGLVILFFLLGFIISLKSSQPYPAIIYPSFSDIPNVSRSIKKPVLKVFYLNQDSIEIDPKEMFYQLPNSYYSSILEDNCTEKTSFLIPLKSRRAVNVNIGLNNFQFKSNRIRNDKQIEKGIAWIKNRIIDITQRKDLNRLEVQWYNLLDTSNNPVENNLVEKFAINLN